jgi:hypothetical protein
MVNRSNVVVTGVLFVAISLISSMCLATPPAKWEVGRLVLYVTSSIEEPEIGPGISHLIQFPGAPENFECTDTFNSDWCLWTTCSTVTGSTYQCDTIPIYYTCLAFQVSSGVIGKVVNVDSDACK